MASISTKPIDFSADVNNTWDDPRQRSPLVLHDRDFHGVTGDVCGVAERSANFGWVAVFGIALSLFGVLQICLLYLFLTGVGVWGNNNPVAWAFDIINFVFWVGIGHAGTLISAILFLFRQRWRTGINRFAEAMTIFAVICAAMFPGVHVGRPWLAYWLFPLPNQMAMWPQFRSPLLWDVFAVGTYFTVSTSFWYIGMIPDIASLRDRTKHKIGKIAYGILALGWTGSSRHWHRFEKMYLLLCALCTPLVLSVHSVVSFDFATSQLPGWHTTFFPPYFVAGAIFGGFAMVILLAIPCRAIFGLKHIITLRHIENMSKVLLATGFIVSCSYFLEFFVAWYSGHHYERWHFMNRAFGNYGWAFWVLIFCNFISIQVLWSKKMRLNLWVQMIVASFVTIGMWFERFVIIVTSLTRDFLPSSWGNYYPTFVDLGMLAGSFGLFFTFFMLFIKFLPVVAIAEVKTVLPSAHAHGGDHGETSHNERRADFQPDEH